MNCPKCASRNVYTQDGEYACMMCGKRWLVNGAKPIVVYKRMEKEIMEGTKPTSGKKGKCVNCQREKFIADKEGLCSACHKAVDGAIPGTTEYAGYLLEVKERLNSKKKKGMAQKPRPRLHGGHFGKLSDMKAIAIKQTKEINSVDPNMAHVISTLQLERLSLLAKADKITQALELLSA